MICERCSRDIHKFETCDYCKRKVCVSCVKSAKKYTKTTRIVICKDCWSKMPSRKTYKSATFVRMPEQDERRERY
jgi:hypothetical protein